MEKLSHRVNQILIVLFALRYQRVPQAAGCVFGIFPFVRFYGGIDEVGLTVRFESLHLQSLLPVLRFYHLLSARLAIE